jgi:hypothetical protein
MKLAIAGLGLGTLLAYVAIGYAIRPNGWERAKADRERADLQRAAYMEGIGDAEPRLVELAVRLRQIADAIETPSRTYTGGTASWNR